MTLQLNLSYDNLLELVEQLTSEQKQDLLAHLAKPTAHSRPLSSQERAQKLLNGFAALHDGLSQEELNAISEAMTASYHEPFDETQWRKE